MGQKFGQHFLHDLTVLDAIADTVFSLQSSLGTSSLVEIGPGQCALTRHVISAFEKVTLLEIDTTLEPHITPLLASHPQAQVIRGDVLESDVHIDVEALVVGNLPYYITSPIFRKFFMEKSAIGGVFLIQKEVADKLKTLTKQKSYLWRLLNYSYDITYCFTVPATAFTPPPKVQSAVISFVKKQPENIDFNRMIVFLDIVSQYTRKTLRKIWKMRSEDLVGFTLPVELEGKRLQELGWEELAHILKK